MVLKKFIVGILICSCFSTFAEDIPKAEKLPNNKGWRIPAAMFKGGKGPEPYGWKTKHQAVWVCSKQTGLDKMRARFKLDKAPKGATCLEILGQDTDKPIAVPIKISLNQKEIFSGNNGFVKEEWTKREFVIPKGTLAAGENELLIENLTEGDGTYKWFMISEACIKNKPASKRKPPVIKRNETALSDLKDMKLPYFCWEKDPFDSFSVDKAPKDLSLLKGLKISAAMNEYQSASFVISNMMDKAFHGRVVLSCFKDLESGKIIPPDFVDMKSSSFMESRWSKGQTLYPDPLIDLNDAGDITIGSKENKEIFLSLSTKNIPAGKYEALINIKPYLSTIPETKIKVDLTVFPFALPKKKKLRFLVFEINKTLEYWKLKNKISDADLRIWEFEIRPDLMDEYMKDLIAHGVNVFRPHEWIVPSPVIKDGSVILNPKQVASFDRFLSLYKKYWQDGFLINVCAYRPDRFIEKSGIEFNSPEWKKYIKEYYSKIFDYMKKAGFKEKDFIVYPFDEAAGKEECKKFLAVAAQIKEANPNIKIFLTQGAKTTLEDIKMAAPLVDVWCLHEPKIRNEKILSFVKSTHKPIWFYDNAPPYKSTPALQDRSEAWKAFKHDLQGCGSWSYNRFVGDVWNDLDFEKKSYYPDMHFVYIGKKGPITSRRWEAYRAGFQDYEYLNILKKAIAEGKQKNIDTSESEDALAKGVKKILAKKYSPDYREVRKKISGEILKLKEKIQK